MQCYGKMPERKCKGFGLDSTIDSPWYVCFCFGLCCLFGRFCLSSCSWFLFCFVLPVLFSLLFSLFLPARSFVCFVWFCFLFCFVCFVLFCLFCVVLLCFVLFCFVLFCFVLCCLSCFVLLCFVLSCCVCLLVCAPRCLLLFCFCFCFVLCSLFCWSVFCFVVFATELRISGSDQSPT